MKKIIALVIIILIATASITLAQPGTLHIGTGEQRPYEFTEGNKIIGMSSTIVYIVFEKMQQSIKIEEYQRAALEAMLANKKLDGIYTFEWSERMNKIGNYPAADLLTSHWVVATRKDNAGEVTQKHLKGKRIGLVRGKNYPEGLLNFIKYNATPVWTIDEKKNLENLALGDVEYVILDAFTGTYLINTMNLKDRVAILVSDFGPIHLCFVFAKHVDQRLVDAFDATLKEFKQTKRYQDIINRYLRGEE